MPSVENTKEFIRARLRYPNWKLIHTPDINASWKKVKRDDLLLQVEARNPHWARLNESDKVSILSQISEIQDILEKSDNCHEINIYNEGTLSIYLRHGATTKVLYDKSDIDLALIKKFELYGYEEDIINWQSISGYPRSWHVGHIDVGRIISGTGTGIVQNMIDLYRSVCLFGQDLFPIGERPTALALLCFANDLFKDAEEHLYNKMKFPAAPFQIFKAGLRIDQAIDFLRLLIPNLETKELSALAALCLQQSTCAPFSQGEFERVTLQTIWNVYHILHLS